MGSIMRTTVPRTATSSRSFALVAALAGIAFSCLVHWQVFLGRVPLPCDLVLQFPPWEGTYPTSVLNVHHADVGDLITQRYPWFHFARTAVAKGALPLWDPYVLLGTPHAANFQSGVFYPLNLPYLLLPTEIVWPLSFVVRTALAFFFMALFVRRLGADRYGALGAGAVFAGGGFMVAWQGWAHADSAVWLPAVLLAVDRLCERRTAPRIALAGAAFALPILAGHPEISFYIVLIGTVLWLYRVVWPRQGSESQTPIRKAEAFAMAAVCALALAAVQLLPGLEWLHTLARGLDHHFGPLRLRQLLAFVSRDARSNPNALGVMAPEGVAYVGMLGLALAPLAFLRRASRRDALFFGVLGACALQVVYGFGPAFTASRLIPVISALPKSRWLLLVDFVLAVFAGLGLTHIRERQAEQRPVRRSAPALAGWISALLVALIVIGTLVLVAPRPLAAQPFDGRGVASSLVFAVAAAGLVLAAGLAPRFGALSATLVLGVLALDVGTFATGCLPFFERARVFPEPPAYAWIRAHEPGPSRVVTLDAAAPANVEMVYALASPTGYDFVDHARWSVLADFASNPNPSFGPNFSAARLVEVSDRRLDLFNVRYLLATTYNRSSALLAAHPERFRLVFSEGHTQVFENPTAMERAFVVPATGAQVVRTEDAVRTLAEPAFDPTREVLVDRSFPTPAAPSPDEARTGGPSAVLAARFGIGRHEFTVRAAETALLVVSESYYPGWRVRVDGRPAEVLRVDAVLKGCVVPAGTHRVVFTFLPTSFVVGAVVSAAAALSVLSVLVVGWRRDSAPPTAGSRTRRSSL